MKKSFDFAKIVRNVLGSIASGALLSLLLVTVVPLCAKAEGSEVTPSIVCSNGSGTAYMTDTDYTSAVSFNAGDTVTVSASDGSKIEAIYIIWHCQNIDAYTITTDNGSVEAGEYGFLHEYVDLGGETTSAVINIPTSGEKISRIRVFTDKDNIPDDVQIWNPPCDQADILVFSGHSDDEILFFGGAIAKYIYEDNAKVQVVYMTQYWNGETIREHEKLDGLWCDGVRYYPVCDNFDDVYSMDIETARSQYDQDAMIAAIAADIRIFRPMVTITHDFNGEYGHGFHQLVADSVAKALDFAADECYTEGECAGLEIWDVPKAYFHLYSENAITLDLREPIDERDGLTPVEIAALSYKQHVSQQWCWFYVSDDPGDKHPEINCSAFGLYRTTVGYDSGDDMMENLSGFTGEDTRIHISTPEELMAIKDNPSERYVLDDDIDMTGYEWVPFSFYGSLNGNGHAILNLKVETTGDAVYTTYDGNFKTYDTVFAGMFDTCIGASIKNLTIMGMSEYVDLDSPVFIGSIAGYCEDTTFYNCTVTDTKLELHANAKMFGVGGLAGYGYGNVDHCTINTTLISVDKNADERDEQFLGGVYGAGYLDVDYCNVTIDGYDSDHGYVHSGGVVGMYIFYPNLDIGYFGSFTYTNVTGMITFFEDNTDRRAYCQAFWGEVMIWNFDYAGNSESFTRNEVYDYSTDLYPEKCADPTYTVEHTYSDCNAYGYNTYTCEGCGYTYRADFEKFSHQFDDGVVIQEPTEEVPGIMRYTCFDCGLTKDEGIPCIEPEPVIEEEPEASEEAGESTESAETESAKTGSSENKTGLSTMQKMIIGAAALAVVIVIVTVIIVAVGKKKKSGDNE